MPSAGGSVRMPPTYGPRERRGHEPPSSIPIRGALVREAGASQVRLLPWRRMPANQPFPDPRDQAPDPQGRMKETI